MSWLLLIPYGIFVVAALQANSEKTCIKNTYGAVVVAAIILVFQAVEYAFQVQAFNNFLTIISNLF
jgi:hypothetical protein